MQKRRKIIYLAGFLFSVPIALVSYINSSFLSLFVNGTVMSFTYALGSILAIVGLFVAPSLWRKMGGYKFLLSIIALDALMFLVFVLSRNAWSILTAFAIGIALNVIIVFALDELLKIFSKNSATGGVRGAYIALANLAWIGSQLLLVLGGSEGVFSFHTTYLVAFSIMILFLLLSFFGLRHIQEPRYDSFKTLQGIKMFLKHKNIRRAYGLNLLLQLFYVFMVIYTPMYLLQMGFSWKEIAMIFSIMLLPFSILPPILGSYADKIGERAMFSVGFLVAALSTFGLFFVQSHEIWVWATMLFLTRVGAATIETMSDAYFFKHIKPENEEFIGIYRTAPPLAYAIGPLLASITLLYAPSFNFIYLVLAAIMFYGVYLASRIPIRST